MKIAEFSVKTGSREEMVDVTAKVRQAVKDAGTDSGMAVCFVPHTTAAVTINENADPDVTRDIIYKLNKDIPKNEDYHHGEGNSDAHVKSTLVGASEHILIDGGNLVLGTWQGVYFCEFDGPRTRRLYVRILSDS